MPISPIVLQRRHAEIGRIRLGRKGDKGQPQKLDRFRFTSGSEQHIADIAALYGGTPQPWDNNGKPEHEVITEATAVPVIAVKGGLSQWLETWSGGGCVHRCDGEQTVDGVPCEQDQTTVTLRERGQSNTYRAHDIAKPTTRLSVMLTELDALGVFRMESHGWNAAAEIPAIAELAAYVGDLVPATLYLTERRLVKDGRTSRFVVPVLDLRIGRARLQEVVARVSGGDVALTGAPAAGPAAIAAPGAGDGGAVRPPIPSPADIAGADLDRLRNMWSSLNAAGALEVDGVGERIMARVHELQAAQSAAEAAADPDGAVDAEIVEDGATASETAGSSGDPDAVWREIVQEGARLGMTPDDCQDDFRTFMGGTVSAAAADDEQLTTYLTDLAQRQAPVTAGV